MKLRFTDYALSRIAERPEIALEYIERVLSAPYQEERQQDGRWKLWGYIMERDAWLRVIVLGDGRIHNAFFDRRFRP